MTDISTAHQRLLKKLCEALHFPFGYCESNQNAALSLMAQAYSLAAVAQYDPGLSYDLGRELIDIAYAEFPTGPAEGVFDVLVDVASAVVAFEFAPRFKMTVNDITIRPWLYSDAGDSAQELVEEYISLERIVLIMTVAGIGVAGIPAAVTGEAIKQGSVRSGMIRAATRLQAGGSVIAEATLARMGVALSSRAGVIGFAVAASAVTAYFLMIDRMEDIREAVLLKLQIGEATEEQFDKIFSEVEAADIVRFDIDGIEKYW